MKNGLFLLLMFMSSVLLLVGCTGPEAKKAKFYQSGKALYEKGDYVKAALQLKNAVQIDPKYADALFLLGMVELKQGNYPRAYADFGKTVAVNPQHLDAQVQMGRLLFMSGDKKNAHEKAALVLRTRPDHEEGMLLLGALQIADNQPEKAAQVMEEMLGQGKYREDIYLLLASARSAMQDNAAAERTLLNGLQKNGKSLLLHRALADFYASVSRVDDSAAEIRKMMALEPKNHTYAITLASLLYGKGREAAAVAELNRMLSLFPGNEQAVLDVAAFYMSHRKTAETEDTLRRGVASLPGSFKMRFGLAEVLAATGRPGQAVTVLKESLQQEKKVDHPDVVKAKTMLARTYFAQGLFDEAGVYVDQVLKTSPHNADAKLLNGQLLLQQGNASKAVTALRSYVNEQPKVLYGYLLLAKAQALNKEQNLALQTLQTAQKGWPDDLELIKAFVAYYQGRNEYGNAEAFLLERLKNKPGNVGVQVELGNLYLASRNFGKAESVFSAIRQKFPKQPLGYLKRGEVYLVQGDGSKAIAEFQQGAALATADDKVLNVLVQACISLKQYGPGIKACEQRVRINERDNTARLLLGRLYGAQGSYRKAEEMFLSTGRYGVNQQAISMLLANLYTTAKDYDRARATYNDLVTKDPGNWQAKNDYASFLADHGSAQDYDKALALAQEAGKARPGDPLILDTIGWIHYRKGNIQQAEQLVKKAVARLPAVGILRYHLGMILYKNGNKSEARLELQKAAGSGDFPGRQEAVSLIRTI